MCSCYYIYYLHLKIPINYKCIVQQYNTACNPLLLKRTNMYYRYIQHIRKESKTGKGLRQRWKQHFCSRPWKITEVDEVFKKQYLCQMLLKAERFWWIQVST